LIVCNDIEIEPVRFRNLSNNPKQTLQRSGILKEKPPPPTSGATGKVETKAEGCLRRNLNLMIYK